jgi:hypothetical protein
VAIYNLALSLKKDTEELYRSCTEFEDEGIRYLFRIMEEEERRQQEILNNIKWSKSVYNPSIALDRITKLFIKEDFYIDRKLKDKKQIKFLEELLLLQKSILYIYERLMEEVESNYEKDIFKGLVRDVKNIIIIIENVKDYIE